MEFRTIVKANNRFKNRKTRKNIVIVCVRERKKWDETVKVLAPLHGIASILSSLCSVHVFSISNSFLVTKFLHFLLSFFLSFSQWVDYSYIFHNLMVARGCVSFLFYSKFIVVCYSIVARILYYWWLLSFPFSHCILLLLQMVAPVSWHETVSYLAIFPQNTSQ